MSTASIRNASTAMSWVAEANAAHTASRAKLEALAGPIGSRKPMHNSPMAAPAWASNIQLRLRPSRCSSGSGRRSTKGAQKYLSE